MCVDYRLVSSVVFLNNAKGWRQESGDKSRKGKLDVRREGEPSPFSTAVTNCHYGLQGEHSLDVSGTSKLPPELSRKVRSQHHFTIAYVREDKTMSTLPDLNTKRDSLVVLPITKLKVHHDRQQGAIGPGNLQMTLSRPIYLPILVRFWPT